MSKPSPIQIRYQSGFGYEFAIQAARGVLPVGRNSPQGAQLGLYAEQFSGTSFTTQRDSFAAHECFSPVLSFSLILVLFRVLIFAFF